MYEKTNKIDFSLKCDGDEKRKASTSNLTDNLAKKSTMTTTMTTTMTMTTTAL